jgi:hypothetical protein
VFGAEEVIDFLQHRFLVTKEPTSIFRKLLRACGGIRVELAAETVFASAAVGMAVAPVLACGACDRCLNQPTFEDLSSILGEVQEPVPGFLVAIVVDVHVALRDLPIYVHDLEGRGGKAPRFVTTEDQSAAIRF